MDDYIDVAERIAMFAERFPKGSLQSELTRLDTGWLCKAYAYRTADDPRPGVGHAFEPVPGKTPYTKDSEAMNAETSAWGRAIVALGFETKKIASAQEMRARKGSGDPAASSGEKATTVGHKPATSRAGHQPTGAAAPPSPDAVTQTIETLTAEILELVKTDTTGKAPDNVAHVLAKHRADIKDDIEYTARLEKYLANLRDLLGAGPSSAFQVPAKAKAAA